MREWIFVWVLLMGLVGLIWVIVLDILGSDHHPRDNQQRNPNPQPHDGEEPHEISPRQPKVAA